MQSTTFSNPQTTSTLNTAMSTTTTNGNEDSITVELNYMKDVGVRPWMYNRPLTSKDKHKTQYGGEVDACEVTMNNARGRQDLTLDQCAFEFVQQQTALSTEDFYNLDENERLKETYYEEMRQLIKDKTGAAEVIIFNHQVRNEDNAKGNVDGYARGIHVDYAASSGENTFRTVGKKLMEKDPKYKEGRFLIINAWRNIAETPIAQDPLVVCDARSLVLPDDAIAATFYPPLPRKGFEQYRLASRNCQRHKWYYLPQMLKEEVLLFKQYDSDVTQHARACYHTAASLPNVPFDTPARQSVEVRAVAFFPDHEPNSCPPINDDKDATGVTRPPEKLAQSVMMALRSVYFWPLFAQAMFRWTVTSEQGAQRFLSGMLQDRSNLLGLKHTDDTTRQQVQDIVLKDEFFLTNMMATKSKLDRLVQQRRAAAPYTWWLNPWYWF